MHCEVPGVEVCHIKYSRHCGEFGCEVKRIDWLDFLFFEQKYYKTQKTAQNKKQPPAISCFSLAGKETRESCGRAWRELSFLPGCRLEEKVVNQVVNNLHPTRSESLTRELRNEIARLRLTMILAMILAMILTMMMILLVAGLV